jgi:hypothetical protein
MTLRVHRGGKERDVEVTLAEQPRNFNPERDK